MRLKVFLILLLLLGLSGRQAAVAVDVEEGALPFEMTTLDGHEIRYEDIRGKAPLFLVFWATWCPVCKEEIPKLKDIYSELAPRGLRFLAINVGVNDSETKARRYVEKYGIDYPVAFDEGSTITRLYGVQGTPTIVVIDSSGTVRYRSATVPEDIAEHFDALQE